MTVFLLWLRDRQKALEFFRAFRDAVTLPRFLLFPYVDFADFRPEKFVQNNLEGECGIITYVTGFRKKRLTFDSRKCDETQSPINNKNLAGIICATCKFLI